MEKVEKTYFVYMIRCEDNSIYTGITTDVQRRFTEHFSDPKKGAKYTKFHRPLKVEAVWKTTTKSLASKLEYRIKHLKKKEKEQLIQNEELSAFFSDCLDVSDYEIENMCDIF